MKKILAATLLLAGLAGCDSPTDVSYETLEVAPAMVACTGVGLHSCLMVREPGRTQWQVLFGGIAGFTFEEGYEYELDVRLTRVADPPADGSSVEYSLVRVRRSALSPRRDELRALRRLEAAWDSVRPIAYTTVLQRDCFCPAESRGPVRIEVTRRLGSIHPSPDEMVVTLQYSAAGADVPVQYWPLFPSLEGMFDLARRELVDGADSVVLEVHPELRHPVSLTVDPRPGLADDEYVLRVLEFSPR